MKTPLGVSPSKGFTHWALAKERVLKNKMSLSLRKGPFISYDPQLTSFSHVTGFFGV